MSLNGTSVSDTVKALAGKIGENIGIKRVVRYEGEIGYYIHHDNKQGAIVELGGVSGEKAQALGKDISMHIVFAKLPVASPRDEVSADLVKKETDIVTEKLKTDPKNASKPPEILPEDRRRASSTSSIRHSSFPTNRITKTEAKPSRRF